MISAYLAQTTLTDVGYRFFDNTGTALAAFTYSGVVNEGLGYYTADVVWPETAVRVDWQSLATAGAFAREYLDRGRASFIPGEPTDSDMCRVFGWLETIDNKPAANVQITFRLVVPAPTPAHSERLLVNRSVVIYTDENGRIVDGDGNFYVELQRNDTLATTGTSYTVTSLELGLAARTMTLSASTFDLNTLP